MIGSVSTWERLVSMKWGMNGHVYLERLSGKFGFGVINFFSHKNPLAAPMLLLKLNLGLKTFKMHDQLLVSVRVIRSSKMLDGKLPLNLFSN